ncbi:hypothetical protein PENSPDRAFT_683188 [Peniophora sp. CONT]|nr:hypothetical protein PENSPDRAFT_683188 [Peniophora sp. CONT]
MPIGLAKRCVHLAFFYSCAIAAVAQNLTIPSESWRKPTSTLTLDSRKDLALSAAQPLSTLTIGVGQPGMAFLQEVTTVYAAFALQDYYLGNSTWYDLEVDHLPAAVEGSSGFFAGSAKLSSDAAYWGLTLFYSYRTYKNSVFLDHAMDAWNIIYNSTFITSDDATSGSGAGRNVSFFPPSNCTGGNYAGGVFYVQDVQNNTYVNTISVGPFMVLSAYLFEATNSTIYQQAAQLSLDFMINHLWNGTIVYDGIDAISCQPTPKPFTLNQAWFVEGLSVWANVTRNDTLTTLLQYVVPNVTSFPAWSTLNGIVEDMNPDVARDTPTEVLKGIFIRGLTEARMRNPGTYLAQYIEAYITVQFNAILDLAQAPAPNNSYYSRSWIGPPLKAFEAGGNIVALDALNAAAAFAAPPTNSSTGGPSSPEPTPTKTSNVGAIAGGVIGGLVAIVAAVVLVFRYRGRKRTRTIGGDIEGDFDPSGTTSVQPFISRPAHNPPTSTSSKSGRMNSTYRDSALSFSASPPASAPDTSQSQGLDHEATGMAELPILVQHLNDLLQGRHGELPPYER